MFESLVERLLLNLFGEYLENFNKEQVRSGAANLHALIRFRTRSFRCRFGRAMSCSRT
jgi:hypothetical protein